MLFSSPNTLGHGKKPPDRKGTFKEIDQRNAVVLSKPCFEYHVVRAIVLVGRLALQQSIQEMNTPIGDGEEPLTILVVLFRPHLNLALATQSHLRY